MKSPPPRLISAALCYMSDERRLESGGPPMAKPEPKTDNVMDNVPYYDKWQQGEGIPITKTFFVQDLRKVPLAHWERTGGQGAFINMEGAEGATGAYVCEIPGGKSLKPQL